MSCRWHYCPSLLIPVIFPGDSCYVTSRQLFSVTDSAVIVAWSCVQDVLLTDAALFFIPPPVFSRGSDRRTNGGVGGRHKIQRLNEPIKMLISMFGLWWRTSDWGLTDIWLWIHLFSLLILDSLLSAQLTAGGVALTKGRKGVCVCLCVCKVLWQHWVLTFCLFFYEFHFIVHVRKLKDFFSSSSLVTFSVLSKVRIGFLFL